MADVTETILALQLEVEKARKENLALTNEHQLAMETQRALNMKEMEVRRAKVEAVRNAKEILTENARSKPVDSREITIEQLADLAKKVENLYN